MSAYAIIHDQTGTIRCCNADGSGGASYDSVLDAENAIHASHDHYPVIKVCDHPHEPTGRHGWRRCARTDKPCAIQP